MEFSMTLITQTERLLIRPFHLMDAAALHPLFSDPVVMQHGPGPQSPKWIRAWLADTLRSYAMVGFGNWAVVTKDSAHLIGYCGLTYYADLNGQPEADLGYRLLQAQWGQGYATEAVRAVLEYAFTVLTLRRVVAMIDPANTASLRVAQKVGMRYAQEIMLPSYDHPDHLYVAER
jgi:[ribosomal protein S5]-alanine N-acetyltransferase